MLVVVGGHSRSIGKTAVMCGIIEATADLDWQAFKITQHGHNICTTDGLPCDCAGDPTHPYSIDQQFKADSTDSGRYLKAGASSSWWLRTSAGQLGSAMPRLHGLLGAHEHTMVESNSLLRFVQPDLYIVVLDAAVADMKDSSRMFLDRADAFAIIPRPDVELPWNLPARWITTKTNFPVEPPDFRNDRLADFVRRAAVRQAAAKKEPVSTLAPSQRPS